MMKTVSPAVVSLLFCAAAHAATLSYDFTPPGSLLPAVPTQQIVPVSGGGITARFGTIWAYGMDRTVWGVPVCTDANQTKPPQPWQWEDFTNAPSGHYAGRNNREYWCEPGDPNCWENSTPIRFDPPIRYFGIWVTGGTANRTWTCPTTYCWDGVQWTHHCVVAPGGSLGQYATPAIEMMDTLFAPQFSEYRHIFAQVAIPGVDGSSDANPCGGDNGHWCAWQWIECVSPAPVHFVFLRCDPGYPIFWDNMVAATGECPHPPCSFEAARRARQEPAAPRLTWGALKARYR